MWPLADIREPWTCKCIFNYWNIVLKISGWEQNFWDKIAFIFFHSVAETSFHVKPADHCCQVCSKCLKYNTVKYNSTCFSLSNNHSYEFSFIHANITVTIINRISTDVEKCHIWEMIWINFKLIQNKLNWFTKMNQTNAFVLFLKIKHLGLNTFM